MNDIVPSRTRRQVDVPEKNCSGDRHLLLESLNSRMQSEAVSVGDLRYNADGKNGNALQRLAFVIDFSRTFTAEEFKIIDDARTHWTKSLPRRSVSKGVMIQPTAFQISLDESSIAGLAYEHLLPDGTVKTGLKVEANRIVFLISDYTRWSDVWPEANDILSRLLELLDGRNSISSFSSEYQDQFSFNGNYQDFDLSQIFDKSSAYLPRHIFERTLNWHAHTGYFDEFQTPVRHRVLTRVNADLLDNVELKRRELRLILFHSLMGWVDPYIDNQTPLPSEITSFGLKNFETLHHIDKSVLKSLLTAEMAKTIGL